MELRVLDELVFKDLRLKLDFIGHILHRRAFEITLTGSRREAALRLEISTIIHSRAPFGRACLVIYAQEFLLLSRVIFVQSHSVFKEVSLTCHVWPFSDTSVRLIIKLLHAHCLVSFLR